MFVEQDLDQDVIGTVACRAHWAIEYHLDVAGLGDGVVVLPVLVQRLEVVTAVVHAVQLHEARQGKHARLMAEAQRRTVLTSHKGQ